jgi:hypothetical protein
MEEALKQSFPICSNNPALHVPPPPHQYPTFLHMLFFPSVIELFSTKDAIFLLPPILHECSEPITEHLHIRREQRLKFDLEFYFSLLYFPTLHFIPSPYSLIHLISQSLKFLSSPLLSPPLFR